MVLCTRCAGGAVCMCHCVHVVQVVSCTCDDVRTFFWSSYVQVVLCTCCKYGIHVHVVLCACRTCCVVHMWYSLHVVHVFLCMCGTVYVHCVVVVS